VQGESWTGPEGKQTYSGGQQSIVDTVTEHCAATREWLNGACDICATPNVIGCGHQDEYDSSDSGSTVASLTDVVNAPTRWNACTLRMDIGSEEWEFKRSIGYVHVSIMLGDQLLSCQLPPETTFGNLEDFTTMMLPVIPSEAHAFKFDVYLPGAARFMPLRTLSLNEHHSLVSPFLDHGVLRMRGSIGLIGGKRKAPKTRGPKPKAKGRKPKQKKLMGKTYPK